MGFVWGRVSFNRNFFRIIEQAGVRVVVDDVSLELIRGATIEYEEELIRSGFRVMHNPQADKGCSCGVSFALKMD